MKTSWSLAPCAIAVSLLLLPAALPLPAAAQSDPNSAVSTIPEDQLDATPAFSPYAFLTTAASANDFEIKAARLALTKAADADVKAYAQRMLDDHGKAQGELLAAGKADKVEIGQPGVDGEQDGMLNELEPAAGADFDRLYIETQVAAHRRTVSLFEGYQSGDTNLHRFAQASLPMLKHHYDEAVAMASRMQIPLQSQSQ